MAAILSDAEKGRIRFHLGYPATEGGFVIALGLPASAQPLFLVNWAVDHVAEDSVGIVREHIVMLDATYRRVFEAQTRLKAKKADDVELNPDEIPRLRSEYRQFAQALADLLQVPLNTNSSRFRGAGGGMYARVVHA